MTIPHRPRGRMDFQHITISKLSIALRVMEYPWSSQVWRHGQVLTLYRSESCKRRLKGTVPGRPLGMVTQICPAYRRRYLYFSIASPVGPLAIILCTVMSVTPKSFELRHEKTNVFHIYENKDADQLRGSREADQRLCFRYIDKAIPLLSKSEISSL